MEMLIKEIPGITSLVTTTVLNIKISKVMNKVPVDSDLQQKTDYDVKTLEIEGKYITTYIQYSQKLKHSN